MRMIGHLADEKSARTFADYLYVQKIESHVDYEKPDGWGIWVNDEDRVEEAARLLTAFRRIRLTRNIVPKPEAPPSYGPRPRRVSKPIARRCATGGNSSGR